ncbi:hypothetical protein [Pontibacter akesuensis]|uniref:Uncharacterized protein n=1 Tax=Pontibacter akesuensis TaxID=388950 RepID=A0A1I7I6L2_9BACT|nr:hypothetical protein [Pontibacter akesuensis]GHA65474.1 hypothetical protein GCM10007389_17910 [Pontibacter akesuensis]SFU68583.1 hypothetical protein SAMN04487941_1959 [Pontibacter akesuensis]
MITTPLQYHAVASRIEQIKDADAGTPAAEELRILTKLIVKFVAEQNTANAVRKA